ncbi:MAG: XdhC/CoxI family protein [Planctomycetota bacterium]|nr:XdhC/CoxI family protein [Planctomycetota bacterium]
MELLREGERAALATVISSKGSTPGKPAFKLLVTESGDTFGSVGGGCMEADVISAARDVIRREVTSLLSFTLSEKETGPDGLICGGKVEVYIEPIVSPHIILLGAGHVAKAIARVGKIAGFGIIVADDRGDYASAERFPEASKVVVAPFDEVLDSLPVNRSSYVAVVTRTHQQDEACLRQALRTEAGYIGMIGSKTKIRKIFARLIEEGFSKEDLQRIHSPIGLKIGAETSEEIAVSVVAEMIQHRRNSPRDMGTPV